MHLTQQRYLAVVIVILVGCGGDTASAPILSMDSLTHEFPPGADWKPATEFVVTNTGGSTLKIERIESGCGCTTSNAGKSELRAGEKTTLRVQAARPAIGYQNARVSIYANSESEKPTTLKLKCWAKSNIPRIASFYPRDLLLRNLDGSNASELVITALERAEERLMRSAECDLPFIAVVEKQDEASPTTSPQYVQRKYSFLAALKDEHPFGRFEGKIIFQLNRRGDDEEPRQLTIPIQIVGDPPIYADPNVLFATISKDVPAPIWRVRIRKRDDTITGTPMAATCNVEWLSVQLLSAESANHDKLDAGALDVRVQSLPADVRSGAEVTIKNDNPNLPETVISVVVTRASALSDDTAGR